MLAIDKSEVLAFNSELDETIVDILIRDGLAMARRVAPCIDDDDFEFADAATAIIRQAVLRWAESGSGGISSESETAGPFAYQVSFDNRQNRRSLFFPSEIRELEALCRSSGGRAFSVDTIPTSAPGACFGRAPGECTYLFGSVTSPCAACGRLLRPGGWPDA